MLHTSLNLIAKLPFSGKLKGKYKQEEAIPLVDILNTCGYRAFCDVLHHREYILEGDDEYQIIFLRILSKTLALSNTRYYIIKKTDEEYDEKKLEGIKKILNQKESQ